MYRDLINNKTDYTFENPKTIVPIPKETDYETGFMSRYYCQKINDLKGFVFEIDNSTYKELQDNPFWKTAILRWRLTGPIEPVYSELGELEKAIISAENAVALGGPLLERSKETLLEIRQKVK